jgi:hypothetical protein
VTPRDLAAWMRAIDGVGRVVDVQLIRSNGKPAPEIAVPRSGLPKWDEEASSISVSRPAAGSTP